MSKTAKNKTRNELKEENSYLRAMLGECLKCHREMDVADFVRLEVWQNVDDGRYHACAWFGGGSGGAGKTQKQAMHNAVKHMISFLKTEGTKALKAEPWRTFASSLKKKKKQK